VPGPDAPRRASGPLDCSSIRMSLRAPRPCVPSYNQSHEGSLR
jgi:hypothetical protein